MVENSFQEISQPNQFYSSIASGSMGTYAEHRVFECGGMISFLASVLVQQLLLQTGCAIYPWVCVTVLWFMLVCFLAYAA